MLHFQILDCCVVTKIRLIENLNNMGNTWAVIICEKNQDVNWVMQ